MLIILTVSRNWLNLIKLVINPAYYLGTRLVCLGKSHRFVLAGTVDGRHQENLEAVDYFV